MVGYKPGTSFTFLTGDLAHHILKRDLAHQAAVVADITVIAQQVHMPRRDMERRQLKGVVLFATLSRCVKQPQVLTVADHLAIDDGRCVTTDTRYPAPG